MCPPATHAADSVPDTEWIPLGLWREGLRTAEVVFLGREHLRGEIGFEIASGHGVFPLEVPPLRERSEDIGPLAAHFVGLAAKRMNRPVPRFTQAHAGQLAAHDWPGNIRELQNTVERAVILAQNGPLQFELPQAASPRPASMKPTSKEAASILTREDWKRAERESIAAASKQCGGKIFGPGGAAELLSMKPTTLASRIKALGIG